MASQLLVLGCSQRKAQSPGVTPAMFRYDGPVYQDFRSFLRKHVWPEDLDVVILSAKFGLIGALTEIEHYDQRMDRATAVELAPAVGETAKGWTSRYESIHFCLGKDYLSAFPQDYEPLWNRAEIFDGPIGIKRQRLGTFIRSLKTTSRTVVPDSPAGRLAYFLPDWDDLLDPDFDFEKDSFSAAKRDRVELHCARLMRPRRIADGVLVSLAQKRDTKGPLRYVGGLEAGTLQPVDLRRHYGLDETQALFGDCGAFSYVNDVSPPISIDYACSLYELYNFDYGASVDHIPVPEVVQDGVKRHLTDEEREERVRLTTSNAQSFIDTWRRRRSRFVPVGTVQGLSPLDYAANAQAYAEMGYRRIALGGLVPLADKVIAEIVQATMAGLRKVKRPPGVHLFGVFRPKLQGLFREAGVASFDSATYFRKAWLRSDQNYLGVDGRWYAAIRVPMTRDGRTRNQLIRNGLDITTLELLEADALAALHDYGRGKTSVKAALDAVIRYDSHLLRSSEDVAQHRVKYERTLRERPWEKCDCPICTSAGIDVLIFRGSNRNKRRGAHNTLQLYNSLLRNP